MKRRALLIYTALSKYKLADIYYPLSAASIGSILSSTHALASENSRVSSPEIKSNPALNFPRDHGAHNAFRTEWWYMTGHLQSDKRAEPFGFQVTFFRSRTDAASANPSRFAAKQLLFAHAAVSDVKAQVLHHDQRIARAGFGIAEASEANTEVVLRDWFMKRDASTKASYITEVKAKNFSFKLQAATTQALLLQGAGGYSRKGPDASQASYYISEPQLAVSGELTLNNTRHTVKGTAWLDHEWSESLLHPDAVGWDWIGMNLLDGSALTAFQLRKADGSALWAGGSFRRAGEARPRAFNASEVRFEALENWKSLVTNATYPVKWRVHTPTGVYIIANMFPNQELDSNQSTGTVYWEGLSELQDEKGALVGRGYLEMTGYAAVLKI